MVAVKRRDEIQVLDERWQFFFVKSNIKRLKQRGVHIFKEFKVAFSLNVTKSKTIFRTMAAIEWPAIDHNNLEYPLYHVFRS